MRRQRGLFRQRLPAEGRFDGKHAWSGGGGGVYEGRGWGGDCGAAPLSWRTRAARRRDVTAVLAPSWPARHEGGSLVAPVGGGEAPHGAARVVHGHRRTSG